jgi:hypothetical protein
MVLCKDHGVGFELTTGFFCSGCGQRHEVLPLSFSVKAPRAAAAVPPEKVERRVVINPDQCVIDNERFFLRGRVVVPVHGLPEPFIWGVWAEVGPKNFIRTNQLWKTEGREFEPVYFGYLDTEIPLYGSTVNLQVSVQTQRVGRRPHFTVLEPEHPLALEQRNGISLKRAEEIAAWALHGQNVLQ